MLGPCQPRPATPPPLRWGGGRPPPPPCHALSVAPQPPGGRFDARRRPPQETGAGARGCELLGGEDAPGRDETASHGAFFSYLKPHLPPNIYFVDDGSMLSLMHAEIGVMVL